MRIYAQIYNDKVVAVSQSPNQMVEVESEDERLLGTYYVDGNFVGYKIVLTSDKSTIIADGKDIATITATVYNWDDTIATDFVDDVVFEFEGNRQYVSPIDGVASIPFASNEVGDYTITTVNEGQTVMTNGSITIKVVSADE